MDLFTAEAKQLMVSRIEKKYEKGNLRGVFVLGAYYSPDDIVNEVKRGSPVGEQIIIAEKKLMDELKRLGGIP